MFFIIIGLIFYMKDKIKDDIVLLIMLYVLFGILMILITVGNVQFKYPFLIIMLPFAANFIYSIFCKQKKIILLSEHSTQCRENIII